MVFGADTESLLIRFTQVENVTKSDDFDCPGDLNIQYKFRVILKLTQCSNKCSTFIGKLSQFPLMTNFYYITSGLVSRHILFGSWILRMTTRSYKKGIGLWMVSDFISDSESMEMAVRTRVSIRPVFASFFCGLTLYVL